MWRPSHGESWSSPQRRPRPCSPLPHPPPSRPPRVLVAEFENDVNPVTQDFLLDAIERGEEEGYNAVVIEMDTPGGLSSSMREIVKGILAADVPVVVYVAPPGASADSAGAVIGMAADVLAMAPQTNIGSSTPVSIGGEDISRDLRRKIVNDAAAYIGELAREHGRNVQVAREMVTKATNLGAREALREERDRRDRGRLPRPLPPDRRDDDRAEGPDDLDAARRQIERVEMSTWKRLLDLLIDPNIIALMLSIGLIGIVVELWNPGLDLPRHGRRDLADRRPLRAAGAADLDRRAAADAARGRLLRRRGVHRLARRARPRGRDHVRDRRADALRPAGDAYQVSMPVALAIAGTLALLFGFALTKAAQVRRGRSRVGSHRLVGEPAEVRSDGLVFVDGELWHARSADGAPLDPGAAACVVEAVEPETLELVVGSPSSPLRPSRPKGRRSRDRADRHRRRRLPRCCCSSSPRSRSRASTSAASSSASAASCPSRRARVSSC